MADTKLADLTALTTPSGDDILYIVDDPAGTPLDRKIALDNLFTRGTLNGTLLNMSQTWGGTGTYTGIKYDVTDSGPSNAASLLMDLQVGGASKFKVGKSGTVLAVNFFGNGASTANGFGLSSSQILVYTNNGTLVNVFDTNGLKTASTARFGFTNTGDPSGTTDTILTRRGAANLRLGDTDAAAPVAQTLSVQSVVAGTTNIAGANLTITGSQGTGTGAGGSIIFQVAPAGSSGSAQNALADVFEIGVSAQRSFALKSTTTNFNFSTNLYGATPASQMTLLVGGTGVAYFLSGGITATDGKYFGFSNGVNVATDLFIYRDAANTLAQRNGANAQAFRVYNTTDGTNSEFGGIRWAANVFTIGPQTAGTGTARATSFVDGTGTERIGINASNGVVNVASMQLITSSSISYIGADTAGFTLRYASGSNTDMMVRFAGTTSSFPALKRSSTTLQARLADDSAFTNIQGKLTTDTAYTATVIVPTGYLTLYDSTGTAYRVPCVV
jgi:hypothetical protein